MLGDREAALLGALGVVTLAPLAPLSAFLAGVRVFLVSVQMHSLGEPLQADEAEVGFLTAVHQLMPLQLGRSWKALVAKFARVLFLKLFFEEGELLQGGGLGHNRRLVFCLFIA